MSVKPPQSIIDYQLARKDEFSASGLAAYLISGFVIAAAVVGLRLWSRKIAKLPYGADDWTLVAALLITVGWTIPNVWDIYHGPFGRHAATMTPKQYRTQGECGLATDVTYTVAYPIARISLVLLYRRIFIQRWFRIMCWIMITLYACYAISTTIVSFAATRPFQANYDAKVPIKYQIHKQSLYLGNAGFNIGTDAILLIMPLAVIWRLKMTLMHKIGLTAIFSLGILTLVASILRVVYYFVLDPFDFTYTATKVNFWTATELYLGLICPCIVTFGPLIKSFYLRCTSRLSYHTQTRLSRITGVSPHSPGAEDEKKKGLKYKYTERALDSNASSSDDGPSSSLGGGTGKARIRHVDDLETGDPEKDAQTTEGNNKRDTLADLMADMPPHAHTLGLAGQERTHKSVDKLTGNTTSGNGVGAGVGHGMGKGAGNGVAKGGARDEEGMALDQAGALAGLDPRNKSEKSMGTTAQAGKGGKGEVGTPPEGGIGVRSDYMLESKRGSE